jgi:hypothetical protein
MTFEVVLLEAKEPPKYLQVSEKALRLNQLGIRNEAIVRHIGVNGKTVARLRSQRIPPHVTSICL